MLRKLFFLFLVLMTGLLQSCTKLHETFEGDLTQQQVSTDSTNAGRLLQGVYNACENTFTRHFAIFPLEELTTDEAIAPTRGTDWDDNGAWRVLHQQKWTSSNSHIRDCFNSLNGIVYAATDVLRYRPQPVEQAEARLIRAWAMYLLLDMFDQVPYREPGESVIEPAKVRKGTAALDYITTEIGAIFNDLPDGPAYKANKWAAKVLLMKCYLNKGVYENRLTPVYSADDMNKVISLADEIINSNVYSFSTNYFDNFAPDNTTISNENIFTLLNEQGVTPNNWLFYTFLLTLHYNQWPGGANGWATLSDFYNKFEPDDKRRGVAYHTSGGPDNPGNRVNIGFLTGQQYDLNTDDPIVFGSASTALIFTPAVQNIETGANLQTTGIRPLKYAPDFLSLYSPDNDFVYFRFPDVLLMKAEAILRGGTGTSAGTYGNTALAIVNHIRTDPSRNASALNSIDLDGLLDERGRELWWEGWRRQDMIRFNKFLKSFQEKDYESDPRYLIFPIPDEQLSVNHFLQQNPGY